MRIVRNILITGLLAIIGGILCLSPMLDESKTYPNYSSQYSFSSGDASLGGNCATLSGGSNSNSLPARLTSGSSFASGFVEKILAYSYLREKSYSKKSTKPFSQYIINFSGTPGRYFVFVLREIII